MDDWGLAVLAFAAITGGIAWVVYFAYELSTLEPPGTANESRTAERTPSHHKAA
jgi:hypothetical protein